MNKQEVAKLIYILKAYYPKDFSADIEKRVEAWYLVLKEYDYTIAQNAVVVFASSDTKGFAPVVGQIVDKIKSFYPQSKELTETEAWNMVYKALGNSAYNSAEEFDKLPKDVQRAVGSPEMLKAWGLLSLDEVNTVIQSNVMRSFRSAQNQSRDFEKIPQSVKEFVSQALEFKEKLMLN